MIDRRGGLAWLGLSAAVIAIDQLAKWALIVALHPGDQRVVTGFFSLVLTFNTGAAFSFLRDAGANIRVCATVPEYLAFARKDFSILVDAALNAESAGMLSDLIEHLFHCCRDFYRSASDHGERDGKSLKFNVEL